MPSPEIIPKQTITKTIAIHAPAAKVWGALTDPALMQQWMSESAIEIVTNWEVGGPITINGSSNSVAFKNTGSVLWFEPNKALQYTHLSSLSRLADEPGNHVIIGFALTSMDEQTQLSITLENFPTVSIYHHLTFYWNVAPSLLKKFVEGR